MYEPNNQAACLLTYLSGKPRAFAITDLESLRLEKGRWYRKRNPPYIAPPQYDAGVLGCEWGERDGMERRRM